MILNSVRLYLDPNEFKGPLRSEFLFRSCYVSNYLTRRVRDLKFSAEGFKAILARGSSFPENLCRVSSENNLIVQVGFKQKDYKLLDSADCHEFFLGMMVEGIEKAAQQQKVPLKELRSAIEDFRDGEYRNEWVYMKKVLRTIGVVASLHCSLDTESFNLTLKLDRQNEKIFEQVVLSTKPDELIFAHKFKDVQIIDGSIVVSDKFGKPAFSVKLGSLKLPPPSKVSNSPTKSKRSK